MTSRAGLFDRIVLIYNPMRPRGATTAHSYVGFGLTQLMAAGVGPQPRPTASH